MGTATRRSKSASVNSAVAGPDGSLAPERDEQLARILGTTCDHLEDEIRLHTRHLVGQARVVDDGLDDIVQGLDSLAERMSVLMHGGSDTSPVPMDGVELRGCISAFQRQVEALKALAATTRESATTSAYASDRLCRRLVGSLRQSQFGNRRRDQRIPLPLDASVRIDGRTVPCRVGDLSAGGARIVPIGQPMGTVEQQQLVEVTLTGIGKLNAVIVGVSDAGWHLAFRQLPNRLALALQQYLNAVRRRSAEIARIGRETLEPAVSRMLATAGNKSKHPATAAAMLTSLLQARLPGSRSVRICEVEGSKLVPLVWDRATWPDVPDATLFPYDPSSMLALLPAADVGGHRAGRLSLRLTLTPTHGRELVAEIDVDASAALLIEMPAAVPI